MPLFSKLAPGFIRMTYSGTVIPHHATIPVNLQEGWIAGENPSLLTSNGDTKTFTAAINEYVEALLGSYDENTSFGLAEIYSVDPETGIKTFVYATDLGQVGESTDPQVPFVQGEFVFRTVAGGILKVFTMEGVYAANARNVGAVPVGPRQDVVDYILGDTNVFYGRRDAYPLAFISFTSKVNDRLRKLGAFRDV